MRLSKKVLSLPWPKGYQREALIQMSVQCLQIVENKERLLVITFTVNRNCTRFTWKSSPLDIRFVLSKKRGYCGLVIKCADGTLKQKSENLHEAMYRYMGRDHVVCYPVFEPDSEERLMRFLKIKKSNNHCMEELNDWMVEAIARERYDKEETSGAFHDDDYASCPEKLPDGFMGWLRREVLPEDKLILYKKGNVHGYCYSCGRAVRAAGERFRQGYYATCPNCGARVNCALDGGNSFKAGYIANVAALQKGRDGRTIFVREWHLLRGETKEITEDSLQEIARYGLRDGFAAKWQREAKENYYYQSYRVMLDSWQRCRDVTRIYDGVDYIFMPEKWNDFFRDTCLKYCNLPAMIKKTKSYYMDIVRMLIDWVRYPAIEKLWKAGYYRLVLEKNAGIGARISWSKSDVYSATGLSKSTLKLYPPEVWERHRIERYRAAEKLRKQGMIKGGELAALAESYISIESFAGIWGKASVNKILTYIKKHGEDTYRDYINDCIDLDYDLSDTAALFPRDLKAAHRRTIAARQYKENKALQEKFDAVYKKLLKLSFEAGDLLIRPARSQKELIAEGKANHHCVASYATRMANKETAIFFVRRKVEPEKSFFTLELQGGRVVQCRTAHNESYDNNNAVKNFVNRWLREVVNKPLKVRAV